MSILGRNQTSDYYGTHRVFGITTKLRYIDVVRMGVVYCMGDVDFMLAVGPFVITMVRKDIR